MNELIQSYSDTLNRLKEALAAAPSELTRDASIQRFEFTIELGWKVIQKRLREEEIICKLPKQCLKEAFSFGLIKDDPLWLQMLEDRNLTVHTYKQELAKEIFGRLPKYVPLFEGLLQGLKET